MRRPWTRSVNVSLHDVIECLKAIGVIVGFFSMMPIVDRLMTLSGVTEDEKVGFARSMDTFLYGDCDW